MKFALIAVIVMITLCSGCVEPVTDAANTIGSKISNTDTAIARCIDLCEHYDGDLNASPCLSNVIIDNWVCDVAHLPRQDVDNAIENQCAAYLNKTAKHFVELNEMCGLIKMY